MHICIEMIGKADIILPIHYNHIIQGFMYKMIDKELSEFLHNKGYGDKRKFKLFCFSNLIGNAHIEKESKNIVFKNPVKLELSSPDDVFCESFANTILKKEVNLGSNILNIGGIKIDRQDVFDNKITLKTLSPIAVYSTFLRPDGSKYTCYFQPGEDEFNRIAEENIRKKYSAFSGMQPPNEKVHFKPLTQPRLHVIKYKGFIIKGYTCTLSVQGPRELLQIAVDSGLGAKNSQGFGCVRIL